MNKTKLQYFLNIISHWNEQNSDIRDELYFNDVSIINKALDQFSYELGENLSILVKNKRKREVIKFYIQQFNRSISISKENERILRNSISLDDYIENKDNKHRRLNTLLSESEKQVREVLIIIFNEIQLVCNQYYIPFLEICKEVNFPLNAIDITITEGHLKREISISLENSNRTNVQSETTNKSEKTIQSEDNTTKSSQYKNVLKEKGFYTLTKVKELPKDAIEKLIGFIIENDVPYQIAMFEYLGFIKHLRKEYFETNTALCDFLGDLFSTTNRTVKGNIAVFKSYSKEDRERYTADKFINIVISDYQKVK